jgi:hypothetical protein
MFVSYETEVPVPMAQVERRLEHLRLDLKSWADVAYRDGEELRSRVGPSQGSIAKEIRLEIGVSDVHRAGVVYPMSWTATGAELLFPRLDADLTLSHAGPDATRIALDGTYEPPLGPFGRVVDRILLRRVAESTVKAWIDRLAAAIEVVHPVS